MNQEESEHVTGQCNNYSYSQSETCMTYENSKLWFMSVMTISDHRYAILGPLLWYNGPAADEVSGLIQVDHMINTLCPTMKQLTMLSR